MELIGQLIGKVAEPVYDHAIRHINYVACVNRLIKKLEDKRKQLELKKAEVDLRVNEARRNGKVIIPQVDKWLEQVTKCIDDVNQFLLDHEKRNVGGNNSSFCQCCCFIPKHHKIGKEAETLTATLTKKLEEAKEACFSNVGVLPPPPPPPDMALPPTAFSKEIDSREILLEDIIEALKVKDMIGIYGMAGVGKTVLVNRLVGEVKSRNLFDKVGIATVSRNPNVKVIRDVIADRILGHLQLHANSEEGRKDILHAELEKLKQEQKKVLLVLDDAWKRLDLLEVGVPCPPNKDFKIVVTSRFRDVCVKMGAKRSFDVNVLDRQEAWSLFCQTLGDDYSEKLETGEGYKDVAEDMVNHFNGLPHPIVTLASALKVVELPAWRVAAGYIRKKQLNEIDGMQENVIGAIEFSFDYLNNRNAQIIFLLCCLFPEDSDIGVDELLLHGISLGLFENDRLSAATDHVVTITEMLKSRSLLLGDGDGWVKMHDVTRDVALHIASKGEFDYLVKEYDGGRMISHVPSNDKLTEKRAISILTKISIMEFVGHDKMEYPNLHILRLQCSSSTDRTPIGFSTYFFQGMGNLKILEIHGLEISSFPTSLGSLKKNLRTLYMNNCLIGDITEVGELTSLEILDLTGSRICGGLCGVVQRLVGLRLLDLRRCLVNGLPDNFVGGLPEQLEALFLQKLQITDDDGLYPSNSYIKPIMISPGELEQLTRLEMLGVAVGSLQQVTDKFLSILGKLFRFNILLSDDMLGYNPSIPSIPSKKILRLCNITTKKYLEQGLGHLLRAANVLILHECEGSPIMSQYYKDEDAAEGFVKSGTKVKSAELMHDDGFTPDPFAKLDRIRAICAPNQHIVLSKLKMLQVSYCRRLRYVFTKSVAIQLQQLDTIGISSCIEMREIFTSRDNNTSTGILSSEEGTSNFYEIIDDTNSIILPSLQQIVLFALPHLKLFADRGTSPPGAQSTFFGEQVKFPELKTLRLRSLDSCEKIWDSHLPTGSFGQLRKLFIRDCKALRYIFSAAVARGLVQLQELIIRRCKKLEQVVVMESVNDIEEESNITFPRLHKLDLCNLDSLHSFCSARNSSLEFPSLKEIKIKWNFNMQVFSYGSLHTPKLIGRYPLYGDDLNTVVARKYEEIKGPCSPSNSMPSDGNEIAHMPRLSMEDLDIPLLTLDE